jgi:hypothetical protein
MSVRKDTINLDIRINGESAGKSVRELTATARQLKNELRDLDPATQAFADKARQLQSVNTTLADINAATRGVNNSLNTMSNGGFWSTIKTNILSVASGFAIFDIAKNAISGLIGLGRDSLKLFDEQAKADAQLKATIISTNNAAGRSFEDLKKQASELQKITLFGDEQTQQAQGILLTFTKVREEIFDRSIPAIQDYATAMDTDLKSASVQVGKALNDPIKGITALSKAGVQFTESQKATIEQLVKTGDVAGAQTIILQELETQFKGSAKAAAEAGLGPYQQLSNRLSDVKESFGELIEKGLKIAAPLFNSVVTILEKFVTSITSGEKATGQFSSSINFTVGLLKLLVSGVRFAINVITAIAAKVGDFINQIRQIPIVAKVLDFLIAPLKLLFNLIANTSAAVAGLRAAMQQSFQNISDYIKKTFIDLQIFAKQLDKLLSFKTDTKERLDKEINELKAQRTKFSDAGKSVGQAYTDAFNSVIEKESQAKNIVDTANKRFTDSNGSINDDATKTGQKSKTTKADKAAKPDNFNILLASGKLLLDEFKDREKVLKEGLDRELDLLLTSKLQGQITDEQYQLQALDIKKTFKNQELTLLTDFNLSETNLYRDTFNDLLQLQNDYTDKSIKQRTDFITSQRDQELTDIEANYLTGLISEEEYQRQSLEVKKTYIEQILALLAASGLGDTNVFREQELEKLRIEKETSDQRIDVAKREAELKKQASQGYYDAFSAFVDLAIQASNREVGERRKNAVLIKTFETARVLTQLYGEISGYYTQYAKVPGGQIIATLFAAAAGARAALNIGKIQRQQFELGGLLDGPSHTQGGIPVLMNGGPVAEAEGGEAFINKRSTAAFRPILSAINSFNGWGRKFETGGVLPSLGISPSVITTSAASESPSTIMLERKIEGLIDFLRDGLQVRAKVVYSEFEEADNTITALRQATTT